MELPILLGLMVLNGVFAMSEIAVVSSRRAKLQKLADEGRPGASSALALHEHPSNFLSTIQVGITSVGVLAGALGENAFAAQLSAQIAKLGGLADYADAISLTIVVLGITYFSVVIGELVPKRVALLRPEAISLVIARPMTWLARIARPLVWLLGTSSTALLRLLRAERSDEPPVSDEEIEVLMRQGAEAGVFHAAERAIVANVLRLDEQKVRAIMTPRTELYFIDLDDPPEHLHRRISESPHSRLPVCRGGLEHVLGMLRLSDLARAGGGLTPTPGMIEHLLQAALVLPETLTTTQLLEQFRRGRTPLALIVDEYGSVEGLVTLYDVLTAIIGDLPADHTDEDPEAVPREDGSWLVDGAIGIGRFRSVIQRKQPLPGEEDDVFHTLAGFVLQTLGHIPRAGESFVAEDLRFEVIDLDGHRIDKVLVSPVQGLSGDGSG